MDDRNLITLAQFSAHLNCASKTHLLVTGQTAPSSYFVDTEALIARSYRKEALQHLQEATPAVEPIAFSEISRDIRG